MFKVNDFAKLHSSPSRELNKKISLMDNHKRHFRKNKDSYSYRYNLKYDTDHKGGDIKHREPIKIIRKRKTHQIITF